MSAAFDFSGNPILVAIVCCNCQVNFGMHRPTYDQKLKDGTNFYCPNGHQQHFTRKENEEERLKRELRQKEMLLNTTIIERNLYRDQSNTNQRSANAYKGKMNHIKRRVANGVCPCCNRSFQNLMNHMKTKHPKYKEKTNG